MWNGRYSGHRAFTNKTSRGYFSGTILKINATAHRVIWKLCFGTEPEMVDHINRNIEDNRLCNLRAATAFSNQTNRAMKVTNQSGVPGVGWDRRLRKWKVTIGKRYFGVFSTIEKAVKARQEAEEIVGFSRAFDAEQEQNEVNEADVGCKREII